MFFKSLDPDDGVAARRAYLVFQISRMLTCLENHLRSAHYCLGGEVLSSLAWESLCDSAVCESFYYQIDICRTGSGKSACCIDEVFGHPLNYSERFKQLLCKSFLLVSEIRSRIESESSHSYESRGVRHESEKPETAAGHFTYGSGGESCHDGDHCLAVESVAELCESSCGVLRFNAGQKDVD